MCISVVFQRFAQINIKYVFLWIDTRVYWYITFRHITTRASKQASEVYDQDVYSARYAIHRRTCNIITTIEAFRIRQWNIVG